MRQIKVLRRSLAGILRTALLASLLFALSLPSPAQAAPGDLDPTFGSGGKVITSFKGNDDAQALTIQPDGKIIVAGFAGVGSDFASLDFALARYRPDGTLDGTFGLGGKVATDFGGPSGDIVNAITLQPDGKIIVAGSGGTTGGPLARYNSDGSLDPTFGSGGKVSGSFFGAFALALQPDGKFLVAGRTGNLNFAVARYNPDGSLDPTFGAGGTVTTDFGGDDLAHALALQPDGKIVAAGRFAVPVPSNVDFALARYNPDGTLDPTFGSGGKVITNFGGIEEAHALALQPDGKIVVAGRRVLARYNLDGSLDITFGNGGAITTGQISAASALSLQPDGKIVVAGSFTGSGNTDFALARYNPDGTPDLTFGNDGKVTTDFGGVLGERAAALALQPDGKIVVAGGCGGGTGVLCTPGSRFALARYKGDPILFLGLNLNKTTFAAGETLTLSTRMANSGPDTTVDQYLGALLPASAGPAFGCPAYDAVAFVTETLGLVLTCLSAPPQTFPPFARNITIPADLPLTVTPNVFSIAWPAAAPPGPYVIFDAFIRSGSVADGSLDPDDLPALGTASLSFMP